MYGSVVNRLMESGGDDPEVGGPATITYYSDRSPATIVKVVHTKTGPNAGKLREIHVRDDDWKVTSGSEHDGPARYEYIDQPDAPVTVFRRTSKGWRSLAGSGLALGARERYYDPHF